jgi:ABC-type transporter Mla MlaB component
MTEDQSEEGHLVFEGALTMRSVTSNFTRLKQAMAKRDVIHIDCHRAEEIDLTFVQLLVAASKTAERSRKKLSLTGPAASTIFDTLTRAGFVIYPDPTHGGTTRSETFWFAEAKP